VICLALLGTAVCLALGFLAESFLFLIRTDRRWTISSPAKVAVAGSLAAVCALLISGLVPRRARDYLDALAARILGARLSVAVIAICLGLLLAWVPHYLTWPLFIDADQFALSARSWDAGLLPYRDLPDFDFPGPTYMAYLLGKGFGWGHTAPLAAIDVAFVALLGIALAHWSRRRFGLMLPGLLGYLPFLCYYLTLDYSQVAQRDWHGPFFAVLGLLALEIAPGRPGRALSAFALAVALAYRPQVLLFLPAVVVALAGEPSTLGQPGNQLVRRLGEWSAAFAASLTLVFAPLLLAGVMHDFLLRLRITSYGGPYNQVTGTSLIRGLTFALSDPQTIAVLTAGALLARSGSPAVRSSARTWSIALAGALLYKPVSPVPHAYLDQPLFLIRSINLALPVAWLLKTPCLVASARLVTLAALMVVVPVCFPRYCSVARSLGALRSLAAGQAPLDPPAGCEHHFGGPTRPDGHYRWEDYRRLLAYLRSALPRTMRVANFLRAHPYPTLNGPTGHLSIFPAAGGLMYLCSVDSGLQDQFAEALANTPESVVVWVPGETSVDPRLRLPGLVRTIRRYYRPTARFGNLEVWGRIDTSDYLGINEESQHAGDVRIN
jgi:hypothetical protein